MFVDFYVPEKCFPSIKKGEIVNVIANTSPGQVFTGKIVSYETVVDQTTGMLQVRASVSNPQEVLLPGGYVTVSVHVGALQKILSIPQTALMYDTDSAYVYLVHENKAVRQNVKLGEQIKQEIQITEGLKPGDIIVSAGTNKIQNDGLVQVIFELDPQ
jgi:RND family efflux transporter MFP subunit